MQKTIFREEQKFGQWWLWLLIIGTAASVIIPFSAGIYTQIIRGIPWGDQPMGDTGLVLTSFFTITLMVAMIWLFISLKLITEIRPDGIWYRFPPLIRKWRCIKKEEISQFEVRQYKPIAEFGGYGIRYSPVRKMKAFNVSGNTGISVMLKNGRRVLIGTQKKAGLESAMNKMMEK